MKRTRSAQLAYRLSRWRELYLELRNQPIFSCCQEVDTETLKSLYVVANAAYESLQKMTIYQPIQVEVTPCEPFDH
jgi:hypothetical protein